LATIGSPRSPELEANIPDSDEEIAVCEATHQPIATCWMPESVGMGEDDDVPTTTSNNDADTPLIDQH
jgi:hypothetical protein